MANPRSLSLSLLFIHKPFSISSSQRFAFLTCQTTLFFLCPAIFPPLYYSHHVLVSLFAHILGLYIKRCSSHLIFKRYTEPAWTQSRWSWAAQFVFFCVSTLKHINGAGRSREQDQTQEGRSSTQINLHWMAQKEHSHFWEQGAIS